jgi:Putative zincin peptidase
LFNDLKDTPEWYWIVMGNLLALVPLGFAALLLWLPYQFYLALGAPLALFPDPVFPEWLKWLAGLLMIAASMLLHELLHGAALLVLGYRARLNYATGYFYATVERGQFLTRTHYIVMSLTPLTVMTLGGGMLLVLLPPTWGQLLLIVLLLNAAASVGDLAVASRTRRYPVDALFSDEGGIKVYVRQEQCANISPSLSVTQD